MKPPVFRLVLSVCLFVGWIAYLAVLVATRPVNAAGWPVVVSRPQIMTSKLDVVAQVTAPGEPVTVEEVLYATGDPSEVKPGQKLEVGRLGECQPLKRFAGDVPPRDFSGPGLYLIPLSSIGKGQYEVAAVPPSPGFEYPDLVRIYPATPEVLAQYRQTQKSVKE